MCLAIPARIVETLPDDEALVDLGGVRKRISLALVEDCAVCCQPWAVTVDREGGRLRVHVARAQ